MKIRLLLFLILYSILFTACNSAQKQEDTLSEADAKLINPYIDDQVNQLSLEEKKQLASKLFQYQQETDNQVRIIFTSDFAPHTSMGKYLRAYAKEKNFSSDSSYILIGLAVNRGIPDVFPNWKMKSQISQKEIDEIMRLIVNGWADRNLLGGLESTITYLEERGNLLGETFLQMAPPFYSVEEALKKPDSIFRLDLREQKLTEFPKEILQLKNLSELFLGKNQIKEIPAEINALKNLQILDISNNQLINLPESLRDLPYLRKINLTNNPTLDFAQATKVIVELPRLKSWEMNFCKVGELPKEIGKLSRLADLQLTGNQLKSLPDEIAALNNLEVLVVNRNALTSLPDGIGKLKKLQMLYADSNQIKMVTPQIGELSKLYVLRLHANQLQTLPNEISKLKALEKLYLSNNQLVEVYPILKGLTDLKDLAIDKNKLGEAEKKQLKETLIKTKIKD